MSKKKLSDRHKAFCEHYIKTLNMSAAYRAVYPRAKSENTAKANGWKLLQLEEVKEYIAELQAEIKTTGIADAQEVLEYYTRVLRSQETTERIHSSGDVVEVKPTQNERLTAAAYLGKFYGLDKSKDNENNEDKELEPINIIRGQDYGK